MKRKENFLAIKIRKGQCTKVLDVCEFMGREKEKGRKLKEIKIELMDFYKSQNLALINLSRS